MNYKQCVEFEFIKKAIMINSSLWLDVNFSY